MAMSSVEPGPLGVSLWAWMPLRHYHQPPSQFLFYFRLCLFCECLFVCSTLSRLFDQITLYLSHFLFPSHSHALSLSLSLSLSLIVSLSLLFFLSLFPSILPSKFSLSLYLSLFPPNAFLTFFMSLFGLNMINVANKSVQWFLLGQTKQQFSAFIISLNHNLWTNKL